jgi:hypothetical protein
MGEKMKIKIYLVGQISIDKPITYEWRDNVRKHFADYEEFEIIDPTANGFNISKLAEAGKVEDRDRLKIYKTIGTDLLVSKDRGIVEYSTMAFANMNLYDEHKPMIGSMFELAWYYDNPTKPVIGIFDGDWENDIYCNHPFVRSSITRWVKTEQEACELCSYYFT